MSEIKKVMKYKQVIVMRTDLGMSKGKSIAQGAHVSVGAALLAFDVTREVFQKWMEEGHTKIVCKVRSLEEIRRLEHLSVEKGIPCDVIEVLGRTEIEAGTVTAIAIGPALVADIDQITKKLKLL